MMKKRRICALLMALGLGIGARTYFLTVKDGRICYREVPGSALVDTGRSVSMLPRAEDRALLSQGVYCRGTGGTDTGCWKIFVPESHTGRISS